MQLTKTICLALLLTSYVSVAKNIQFASGNYQNTLIELYTSEGCSSCPPADKRLSLLKNHPKLFSEIVPIAFHVDYWDYIGWQDKFANPKYSNRQRQYYQQNGISSVYTPEIIKNGKEDRSWNWYKNRSGVSLGKKVGKLSVDVLDGIAYITFDSLQKRQPLVAHIVLLGSGFENKITAGENDDRTLKHDFVALKHTQKLSKVSRWSIPVPTSTKTPKRLALAVWISTQHTLKPIQTIGSWL